MAIVGYARVSTQGQYLTAQIEALKAAGGSTIYREKRDRMASRERPRHTTISSLSTHSHDGSPKARLVRATETRGRASAAAR